MIIHIGLPKTGTTFLQQNVFPKLDLGLELISKESLSGKIFEHNYDRERNIYQLKKIYPDAKIIIGFRKHSSYIASLYCQWIHEGHYEIFKDFFDLHSKKIITPIDILYLPLLEMVMSNFKDYFVYFQEELLENPQRVITDICSFIGVPVPDTVMGEKFNVSLKSKPLIIMRLMNKYFGVKNQKYNRFICQTVLNRYFKRSFELDPIVANEIDKYFARDWRCIKEVRFIDEI